MESREEEMNIYLKVIKTVALKVKTSETIKNIKAMVREHEGISENCQELFFTGERLKDDHRLVDYGIQTDSTLHLILQDSDSIKFFVYIPSYPKTFELEAKTRDTVQSIKSFIQETEGIQSDSFTLFFCGKLLEDDRTLASHNIQAMSVIYLVFNPRDVLSVSVKMPNGEILKPEVKMMYTILDLKSVIGSMIGFPVGEQHLTYAGKQLEDLKTLACYKIGENSILEMLPFSFQIFLKAWCGKTFILNVRQQDKVRDVKDKIFQKMRFPVDLQNLVFAGKSLKDGRDLASYNIQKHSTLHVVLRSAKYVFNFRGPLGTTD